MPTTTPLTTLALTRAAQPPTGTCPASLQAILLGVALRRVEAAIRANRFTTLTHLASQHPPAVWQTPDGYLLSTHPAGSGGVPQPDNQSGHLSHNQTPITPTPAISCGPVA